MPFNIAVVGSGIAGLGAAIALADKGHCVTVIEATSSLRPVGGTIVLQANASRILDRWGVYQPLLATSAIAPIGPSTRSYRSGKVLIQKPPDAHRALYGYDLLPVHRAELQAALYKATLQRHIAMRFGCPVSGFIEDKDKLLIVTLNGEEIVVDIVVGADGINSTVRKTIDPCTVCVRDSGLDITRASIPQDLVRSDPETSIFMDQISLWCGPMTTLAVMPVRRGPDLFLGLDCCHGRGDTSVDHASRDQSLKLLRHLLEDFAPAVRKLLGYVDEAYAWRLLESNPNSWVDQSGRVVLVGDAAHAALPWLGQGGAMALEDATTLAECLEWSKTIGEVSQALQVFQEIRQPRCRLIQKWASIKGRRAMLADGPEQRLRDEDLRSANAWVRAESWNHLPVDVLPELEAPEWKAWLIGHDARDFAIRELKSRFEGVDAKK